MTSKTVCRAASTAVFVSLYLSASSKRNYFDFSFLICPLRRTAKCSTVLIASMKTSMFGSSSSEAVTL